MSIKDYIDRELEVAYNKNYKTENISIVLSKPLFLALCEELKDLITYKDDTIKECKYKGIKVSCNSVDIMRNEIMYTIDGKYIIYVGNV